jgi:hypothetical protein
VNRMNASHTEQILSIEVRCDEPEVQISLSEFDYYCTLFEEIFEEMERNKYAAIASQNVVGFAKGSEMEEPDLDSCLNEFDLAEIKQMRERYGLSRVQGRS